jgi:hypothetical protein
MKKWWTHRYHQKKNSGGWRDCKENKIVSRNEKTKLGVGVRGAIEAFKVLSFLPSVSKMIVYFDFSDLAKTEDIAGASMINFDSCFLKL